jgi:tRNA (guanine37-N1)-methyltransferase
LDERIIEEIVTEEISIGDYVLTGGEPAALVLMDTVSRLVPGVLGKIESFQYESFSEYADSAKPLLEYPHYTRPPEFRGRKVPEVLLSGHHGEIEKWRHEQALEATRRKRPDLLEEAE